LNEDPRFAEGERFYLFREQLEAGIAINRPQTPAAVFARAEIGETLMQIMSFGDAEEAMEAATAEIDQLIEDNQYAAE
jgi:multiple sugar transport system substrate-binding protein